jgi:long-chain acyl-CoA synthetase
MNIADWLERAGRSHGGSPAIAVAEQVVSDYRRLARRSAALAASFKQLFHLEPGERIAIIAKNCPEYIEALFGAWWGGYVAVPVNAKLHPAEIDFILAHAGASVALVGAELAEIRTGSQTAIVTLGSAEYERIISGDEAPLVERAPDDLAWLFYTSGTTGRPKGAMLTHRNLTAMSLACLSSVNPGIEAGDALLHAAPMSHGSGLYIPAHICRMGLNVIPGSGGFEASEVASLLRRWRGVSMFAAPTMVRRLNDCPDEIDLRAIRTIIWGGAPMHVGDVLRALDRFGPCLAQIYGQGETPMTATVLSKDVIADRAHPRWLDRLGSAGTINPVVKVRVADSDDKALPDGVPGEVLVRGATVMKGYWNSPDETAAALKGGWLHTGDIGVFDQDGFLTLKDRAKDLVISGGSNIYPREVEEVLLKHPDVVEASVIGRDDPEWGEVVVAYVVGGADPAALDRLCLEHIARFKRPKDYVFLNALPKNNYGKILKTELRELDKRRPTRPASRTATEAI